MLDARLNQRRQHRRIHDHARERLLACDDRFDAVADRRGRRRSARPSRCRPLKTDDEGFAGVGARAGYDADQPAVDGKLPGVLHLGTLCVPEIVEPIEQLFLRHIVATANLEGAREDAGQHPIALAVQPGVDHAREREVVVTRQGARHHEQRRGRDDRVLRRTRVGGGDMARTVLKRGPQSLRRITQGSGWH